MAGEYQKKLDSLLLAAEQSGRRPRLLLQSCCGPCSSYVLEYLTKYMDTDVLYFNPNIWPPEEYEKRLSEQRRLLREASFPGAGIVECAYAPETFFDAVRGLEDAPEGGARCAVCFRLRLEETAKAAKALGYDYFGTTLTVSPHKNAPLINDIGEALSARYGVAWLPSDFKKRGGYLRSIRLSQAYDLYRQNYCGCKFSMRPEEEQK